MKPFQKIVAEHVCSSSWPWSQTVLDRILMATLTIINFLHIGTCVIYGVKTIDRCDCTSIRRVEIPFENRKSWEVSFPAETEEMSSVLLSSSVFCRIILVFECVTFRKIAIPCKLCYLFWYRAHHRDYIMMLWLLMVLLLLWQTQKMPGLRTDPLGGQNARIQLFSALSVWSKCYYGLLDL